MKKRQPRATLIPVLVCQRSRGLGACSPFMSRTREPCSGTTPGCHPCGEHAEQSLYDARFSRQDRKELAMEVVYECWCGLDVHAKAVVACLVTKGRKEIRTFATMTDELLQLGEWLSGAGCTHVASESTGVYGQPVFNILASLLSVVLVNARHLKAVPGRKTDVRDCEWLADL